MSGWVYKYEGGSIRDRDDSFHCLVQRSQPGIDNQVFWFQDRRVVQEWTTVDFIVWLYKVVSLLVIPERLSKIPRRYSSYKSVRERRKLSIIDISIYITPKEYSNQNDIQTT